MRRVPATKAAHRRGPDVTVVRRSKVPGVKVDDVRRDARRILIRVCEEPVDVCVSLVGDREIHELNRRYRQKDRPTDVLAFAMREGEVPPGQLNLLGDVVISLDTAARQARERHRTLAGEVRILLVHGVLHLLGYDHEKSVTEARRMQFLERRLLAQLRHPGKRGLTPFPGR